jgi:hypothetical protein
VEPTPFFVLSTISTSIRVYWPFHFEILLKQKSFPTGNVFKPRGVNMCGWSESQEAQMTKLVLRCVTQGTFLTALIAALSFTPAFAFGGGGGAGAGGVPAGLLRLDPPPSPPSSYPRRSGIKATHKIKKNTKESSIRRPRL